MFSGFMLNAWAAGSMVAVVAGVVGFFIVLRGSAFVAHALPNGAFAGAAGASLIGVNALVGLGSFSVLGALLIAALGRHARHDIATALTIVMMLGLGALFLSMTTEYGPQIYALLFGEVLGVSTNELLPTALIGLACIGGIIVLYRPLMYSSVMPDVAAGNGVSVAKTEMAFLIVVALTTSMAVPVVGSLLIFSLLISPPAAARSFTNEPGQAMVLSVILALVTVWMAIAISYASNLPIGFFVGSIGAVEYAVGRRWMSWQERGSGHDDPAAAAPRPIVSGSLL